ncbi:MAG TPA: DUF47 family protein [candidate division Zixibacteria bacterium]|nr:DUF47 domain-containing protein [candidate division Zixibacteria bacterium]MDD4918552.1 DUF47 family protein [candidate division Zixibacteria bacterium]MDM7971945.1 DUF47 family protein [candidate division Zixibacteria bacterium]HOD65612.1 DUF47 family protein [candidate division Zixibacteria bacterium]HOZ07067.1 DUF47 family protein [candidate division Zixibacteria bacterium]
MLEKLLPRETSFFKFFEQTSGLAIEVCVELDNLVNSSNDVAGRVARIEQLEHDADEVTHQCIDALHATFITPIDRADIHRLIKRIDDIIDCVDSAAARFQLYGLTVMRPEIRQLTQVLIASVRELDKAVRDLPALNRKAEAIQECCQAVYEAEREADDLLRAALVRLFAEEKDVFLVIKWKEMFERVERATDRCQEVANIISGIVIEAS